MLHMLVMQEETMLDYTDYQSKIQEEQKTCAYYRARPYYISPPPVLLAILLLVPLLVMPTGIDRLVDLLLLRQIV